MNKFFQLSCIAILIVGIFAAAPHGAAASDRATKEECVAFVKRAVEYFKLNGSQKALTEFINPAGKFIDRDLYIIAYDTTGLTLAHGANPKLVGRNRLDEQDTDGTYYNKERNNLMKTQNSFWTHYKFTDPITHKILPKSSYCEVTDDPVMKHVLICSGVYDVQ
jgi:cytochrome c